MGVPNPNLPMSADAELACRFMGGLLLILGCMLFTVRWNTLNGKLSGLACIICAGNAVYATYFLHDKEIMVPRPFYIYAVVLALCGLHLMFRANPMLPKPANANEKKKS